MDKNMNIIMLERKLKTLLPVDRSNAFLNPDALVQLNDDLKNIGYQLNYDVLASALLLKEEDFKEWADEVYKTCLHLVGGDVKHKPLYKDFPVVMSTYTTEDLYKNQVEKYRQDFCDIYSNPENFKMLIESIYTYNGGHLNPLKKADLTGLPLTELSKEELSQNKNINDVSNAEKTVNMKTIGLATIEEFELFVSDLIAMKNSLSDNDREIIAWTFNQYTEQDVDKFVKTIVMKETLVFVYGKFKERGFDVSKFPIQTATDILRIVALEQELDVSLAQKLRFKSISRSNRRTYLAMIEELSKSKSSEDILLDMMRHREKWKRLNEKLHSGEYKQSYPEAAQLFVSLIEKDLPLSFNGKVELAMIRKDLNEVMSLLITRPGEFARKLNYVLTTFNNDVENILNKFKEVSGSIPNDILFNLTAFFENSKEQNIRLFIPKGNVQKFYLREDQNEQKLTEEQYLLIQATLREMIKSNLSTKEAMGEVYLSDELKNIVLPTNNRSVNSSKRTLPRGSKLSLKDDTKIIRAFLYWVGFDIDLSAQLLDIDFNTVEQLAYYHQRSDDLKAYHSGDITNAEHGASEFIDIDIEKCLKSKTQDNTQIRYVAFTAHVYRGPNFAAHKECFMGVMERESIKSDEPYNAKTVKYKFDLTNESATCLGMVVDLITKELIVVDLGAEGKLSSFNNLNKDVNRFAKLIKSMIVSKRVSVYDVIALNVEARGGTLVNFKEREVEEIQQTDDGPVTVKKTVKVDLICDFEGDITPYDTEKIFTQYM